MVTVEEDLIPSKSFENHNNIETVVLESISEIGEYAFNNCENLQTLNIEKVNIIGRNSFSNCVNLHRISIPLVRTLSQNIFSNSGISEIRIDKVLTIEESAFENCLMLSSFQCQTCEQLSGNSIFKECQNLESISFPNLRMVDVTSANLFYNCNKLTKVSFGNHPPKVFNRQVFANSFSNKIKLNLPNDEAYYTYDNDIAIEGDVIGDSKWCGLSLYISIVCKINDLQEISSSSIRQCILNSQINDFNLVTKIEVISGVLKESDFDFISQNLQNLNHLELIDNDNVPSNCLTNNFKLKNVSLGWATSINSRAFSNLNELTEVRGDHISAIFSEAFINCPLLKNIHFPELINIYSSAFENCINLEKISFPKVLTINNKGFFGCLKLLEIDLPNVSTVKESAFSECTSINSVILPKIKIIEKQAFSKCSELRKISFPIIETIQQNCFEKCQKLSDINLPKLNTLESYVFLECSGLLTITLPKLIALSTGTFSKCSVLESIFIPEVTVIPNSCFSYCEKLIIDFSNFTRIGEFAFQQCNSLTVLDSSSITKLYTGSFKECGNLIRINLPNINTVPEEAFISCVKLEEVSLKNVESLSKSCFSKCESLQRIEFNQILAIPESAFSYCIRLENISFERATSINRYSFANCISLEIINLTTVKSIGYNCFENCYKLRNIDFPSLENIGESCFKNCSSIEEIIFLRLQTLSSNVFEKCTSLVNVYLPQLLTLESEAFKDCQSLLSIEIESLTTINGNGQFKGCQQLKNVSFISLRTISDSNSDIFENCQSLNSIQLGSEIPKTFNKNTFINRNSAEVMTLLLPGYQSYLNYDASTFIEGDIANDQKWCSIELVQLLTKYRFNQNPSKMIYASNINEAISKVNIPVTEILQLEILEGYVDIEQMSNIKTQLTELEYLFISNEVFNISNKIPDNFFSGHQSIKEIHINTFLELGESSFGNCPSLETFTSSTITTITSNAFSESINLKTIEFNSLTEVSNDCFKDFVNLQEINLPKVETLYENCFFGCSKLETIDLPSLKSIKGKSQFSNCENLKKVVFKALQSIESTNSDIFDSCQSLEQIELSPTVPKIFHKDTFVNSQSKNRIQLILPTYDDYVRYDKDTSIDGDIPDDAKWCSLELRPLQVVVKINENKESVGGTLEGAITFSNVEPENILTIDIIEGKLDKKDFCLNNEQDKSLLIKYPNLKEFIIRDNIQLNYDIIPNNFFSNHKNLETIIIQPDCQIIFSDTFLNCEKIQKVSLNCTKIPTSLFKDLKSLAEVEINSVDEIPEELFYNCQKLQKVTATNATLIKKDAFYHCIALIEIEFESVQTIQIAQFSGLLELTTVHLNALISIPKDSFKDCVKLETLIIEKVENLEDSCFSNCKSLKILNCPNLEKISTNTVFENCVSLEEVNFDRLTNLPSNTFENLLYLKNVNIPQLKTTGSFTFRNCSSLENITFFELEEIGSEVFCKCTSLELVNLPSLSKMNERCFIGCISLVTISLPSLFVIPSESFKELPNLTTIQFEKATEIQESAFQNCYKLYDIHLPKVELIGDNAFMNCISIQDIVLNSLIKISDYIFSNCSHLQKIEINNLNSTGVNCFEHCTSLKEISIPKLITLEKETLFKCSDLESVNFPQVEIVKTRAFSNCISIKSIKLSELHTIEGEEIFQECISLGSSSFPKLTYANKDDPNLFENCKNMASIELPANPPKVFHHDVFKNQHSTDPIELLLPTFGDYWTYDNNNEIQGDEIGDCYWCGLYFPKLVTEVIVNQYNTNQKNINDNKLRLTKERKSVIGNSLSMAVWRSGCKQNTDLSFPTVSSIEIVGGKINSTDFVDKLDNNMAKYYPNLEYFIIESGVKLNESELPSYSFKDHSKVKLIELYEVVFLRTESLYSSSLETLVLHNVPKIHFSDFQGCLSLTTLTVDIVTEFESHLFINHSSIAEIIAPQLQTIGDQCFENSSIKTVQCPLLTSLGYAAFRNTYEFTKFTNLGTITIIPEECFYNSNIQEIDSTSIIHLKKGCFMNSNVHRVILPNLQSLSEAVFKNTNHLESIDPLTNIYTIPIECFYNSSLTQIELMNCNTIETKAFEKSHIEIVIGTKLEIIESYAFCNCQKLKEISFATVIKIGESTFELSNIKTVESETLIQIGKASFRSSCIQAFNCPNIENILESSFENCQFLETISELNNIHLIPLKCFYNCSIEIISSTSVEIIGESAFEKSDIQKIDFQTVKLIEKNGFKDCSYLQITNAPVLETIQGYSFYNCTNLNYILLPKVKTVGEYSFAYSNLQTFNKEDDTETLMINSFAFMNSSIESITVSSEITMGESIFKNCVELFKIQFDKIKEIASSMCANSLKLEEVIIPKCEIIGDYAFYGCIKLQKIDFTSIKVIKAYAFSSTSLVTITSTKIEYIGSHAFEFCLELTNVNLMSPSNNLIIGSSCFLECKKLKEAMIHGTKAMIEAEAFASSQLERIEISSLLEIESTAFKSCSLLLYVKFDNIVEIPSSLFRGLTKLAEVIIPKCEIIGNYSFFGCSSLEHINMQSIQIINWYAFGQTPLTTLSFTTIQFIGPYSFSNCTKLTTVEIVNSMPSLVISIDDYCFSFTSLKTITIICQSIIIKDSAFKNSTINEIAIDSELVLYPSVFENCIELNKVQLALIKEINASIFKNCVKLEDVVIPKCEIIGEYAFYGCILLKQIDFESIKVIESFAFSFTALVTINSYTIESLGSHAFEHCLELTTINLNSPTSNFVVGSYCFSECSKLQYITVNAKTIESYAFNQCSAISILEFPKLKILEGSGHFCQCKKLETIKLPLLEEVSRYNNDLFEGCSLMREIYLPPTPPKTFSNQAFSDISKENCRIVLNSLAEYVEYDDDTSINGDEFNDCYWCGFFFSDIYHSIIIYGNEYHGNSLEKAIQYSPFPSTRSVIINAGHLYSDELPFYQRTIESLIIFSEVVIHGTLPVDSFSQWSSLEEVELDVFTSLTYSIFQDSSIKIFKGKYLQEISADTFKDCSLSLESIELDVIQKIPNNAFQAFSRLETIILPNLQTIPHQAFKDCTSIQTIRFDNVVIIEGNEQFSGCSSLTNIYLPQLQTIDSSNEYIFAECYELIGIELPSTPPNTFHRNVFRSLSQEIELTTPNIRDLYLYDNSTDVEGDKKGDCRWCSLRLKPIEIEILINKEYTYFVNALSFIPNDITVTELSIVRGQIFQESFQFTINENNNDNGPMSVLFDSLESFEIQSETIFHSILPSKLFKNHSSIKNITLASTKGIGRSCFEYCIRLEDITVSLSDNNLNLLNTTTTGETRLLSTKILEGEETEFQICERAFYGCTKLKKVSIELIDKIESSAFENCISLNEIKHTNLKNIEDSAFKGCSSLISFDSTTLEILFDSAFKDCSSLQSVNIPYVSEMIGDSHFENCVSLSEIHLNSLAIVDYNSENIFQNCPNFESIELPFYPPKTFNDNLFINTGANLSEIELILENDESYYYYADSEGEYLGVKIYQEIIRQPGEPFDFSFFFLILTGVLLFLVIVTGIFFLILGIHKGWFKCSQNHDRHLNLISQNSDQLETNSESENSDEINQTSENIIL
ncbi:hypothetical protein TRFO_34294 [Tritrichomonas foetus]|uniref:Surface antigen BspA-like n=1 Tax=Tritrichomonas foetus TaxID=1144522 RepID=A0A1J4JPY9_9EUKA|nr:hypothetical protein TRFO_34294 [Tritrichomonas foetus]|eukprot:OHS99292.1 hypothetical protein TRFO_34294 [Tritrichomonas foetus]